MQFVQIVFERDYFQAVQQDKESDLVISSLADSIVIGNQELNLPDAWGTPVGWGVIASLTGLSNHTSYGSGVNYGCA